MHSDFLLVLWEYQSTKIQTQARDKTKITLKMSWGFMVGDREKDILCAAKQEKLTYSQEAKSRRKMGLDQRSSKPNGS